MRNLYFETIEALFEADIKPWDIENVSMVSHNIRCEKNSSINGFWCKNNDLGRICNFS